MKARAWWLVFVLVVTADWPETSRAGVAGKAAREAAERVVRRLARGPTSPVVSAAGRAGALAARHGDGAARALARHGRLAGPVVDALGPPAARALSALSPRNARRLAMMTEAGDLARTGRAAELLGFVGRSGDRAMDFVRRHKGALAVSAVLAAFLAGPAPFLDGSRDLAGVAASAAAGAVAAVPGRVAFELAGGVDWTLTATPLMMLAAAAVASEVYRVWSRASDGERRR